MKKSTKKEMGKTLMLFSVFCSTTTIFKNLDDLDWLSTSIGVFATYISFIFGIAIHDQGCEEE